MRFNRACWKSIFSVFYFILCLKWLITVILSSMFPIQLTDNIYCNYCFDCSMQTCLILLYFKALKHFPYMFWGILAVVTLLFIKFCSLISPLQSSEVLHAFLVWSLPILVPVSWHQWRWTGFGGAVLKTVHHSYCLCFHNWYNSHFVVVFSLEFHHRDKYLPK